MNSLTTETDAGTWKTWHGNIMKADFNTLDAFATTILSCILEWRNQQSHGESSYIITI